MDTLYSGTIDSLQTAEANVLRSGSLTATCTVSMTDPDQDKQSNRKP